MSDIPCAQPFDDGTHCEEPRGHHLSPIARQHIAQAEQHQPETGFDEARAKGIPEHLRPELGLEPSDEPTWNPYRTNAHPSDDHAGEAK